MKKIAIVYWSGTGNTAQMAEAVAEGAGAAGAQANLFTPSDFSPAQVKDYDAIAFGCPAMGAEQLEDFEFEPLFLQCAPELNGKDIALFGSYGWATASGCRPGRTSAKTWVPTWCATASLPMRRRTIPPLPPAATWAPPWRNPPINANRPGTDFCTGSCFIDPHLDQAFQFRAENTALGN